MNKWISIDERLPEPWERVLVINKQGFMRISHRNIKFDGPEIVTHWMPLPEPPEQP